MSLTDEEILVGIKYAREKAEITYKSFEECLIETLDAFETAKKNKMSIQTYVNMLRTVDTFDSRSNPIYKEPVFYDENKSRYIPGFGLKNEREKQYESIDEYVEAVDEQIKETVNKAKDYLGRYNARVINSITGASNEEITDERKEHRRLFDEIVSGTYDQNTLKELFSKSYFSDPNYQSLLKEASTLQRKKYYAICKLCDDRVILKNHLWLLNTAYNYIQNTFAGIEQEVYRRYTRVFLSSTKPSTRDFIDGLRRANDTGLIGFVHEEGDEFNMRPTSFQSVLTYFNEIVDDIGRDMAADRDYIPNLETIKAIKESLEEEVSKERNYSFSECREHLIEQIHLTNDEREMFDDSLEEDFDLEIVKPKSI